MLRRTLAPSLSLLRNTNMLRPRREVFIYVKINLCWCPYEPKSWLIKKERRSLSIRWPTAFFCFQPRHVYFFFQVCQAIDEGYCCFGTIDSWLLFKLTKGGFALFSLVSQTSSKPRLKTLFLFFFPFRGEFFSSYSRLVSWTQWHLKQVQ